MSHELRTPLNAIIGFSETMTAELFGPLGSARYLEYAQDIHRSGVFLHDLISDMLDMVKIEAGHRALHPEPFDFPAEIEETLRMVRPRAASGDVTVGLEVLDPPELLVTDRRAFKQIVLNLIGNAVKFTLPGGTVTVRLSSSGEDALLQVIDTGIGISAANLAKLGTPFFRIEDNPHQAGIEGTGLGVALTKSLIEVCGWSLTYDSELGHGTTVTVTMPGAGRTSSHRVLCQPARPSRSPDRACLFHAADPHAARRRQIDAPLSTRSGSVPACRARSPRRSAGRSAAARASAPGVAIPLASLPHRRRPNRRRSRRRSRTD